MRAITKAKNFSETVDIIDDRTGNETDNTYNLCI